MRQPAWTIVAVALGMAITACNGLPQAVAPTSTATPAPPTATATFTPVPTNTPTPVPTISPQALEAEAADACEAAFSAPVTSGEFSSPLIALRKTFYDENPTWEYLDLVPFYTALSADETKTLLCIQQNRDRTGTYSDGQPAYRLTWSLRVVAWPGGAVVASQNFRGADPTYFKSGSGPGYGSRPSNELFEWLAKHVKSNDVFFVGENVSALAFSPDGRRLIAANSRRMNVTYSGTHFNAQIVVFDLATGETLHSWTAHKDSITRLTVSPDGRLLASSGRDLVLFKTEVKIWDLERGQLLHTIPLDSNLGDFAFSGDGRTLAIDSYGIILVDTASGQTSTFEDLYGKFAVAPDGLLILKGDTDTLSVIDAGTGQTVRTLPIGFPYAITPDGRMIASEDSGGSTVIWDAENVEQVSTIPVRAGYPSILVLQSNFLAVFTAPEATLPGEETEVQLWDTRTGALIRTFPNDPLIGALAFSPDGGFLATATNNGFVKLWKLTSGP
ncbi:MAG: hypothetical protein AB1564_06215 [Chloroflexota bacterium]